MAGATAGDARSDIALVPTAVTTPKEEESPQALDCVAVAVTTNDLAALINRGLNGRHDAYKASAAASSPHTPELFGDTSRIFRGYATEGSFNHCWRSFLQTPDVLRLDEP